MDELEHPTKKKIDTVMEGLWEVKSSLHGLAGLFQTREEQGGTCIDTDTLYGIGNNLKLIASKVSCLEDGRCKYLKRD